MHERDKFSSEVFRPNGTEIRIKDVQPVLELQFFTHHYTEK